MHRVLAFVLLGAIACGGGSEKPLDKVSRNPVSVRGWILDVKDSVRQESAEVEIARRAQLFQATSVWVENIDYATGGVAENGAFVVLDVPPQAATIGFNAPGAETAELVLENIPPSADVFVPDVILEPGGVSVLDPKKILVRLPGDVAAPTRSDQTAKVAGHTVNVTIVPLSHMTDRREFPDPGGFRPIAIFK